jgi:hypothetical protein
MSAIPFVTRATDVLSAEQRIAEVGADRLSRKVIRYVLVTVIGPAAAVLAVAALLPD